MQHGDPMAHGGRMKTEEHGVVVSGLTKRFGAMLALDDVDFEIAPGEALGLLGHNGAGKTTAVRILATLLRPDGGQALVGGHDVVREPAAVRAQISLAGQQATLDERLTGRENLVLLARLQRVGLDAARRRSAELLERLQLTEAADRQVGTYSLGMRRRLDLAACLLVPRPVVFLDEPTTGLDPASRAEVWGAIRSQVDDGAALLLTTQYLEEADRLADRITVLSAGRVVADGTPGEIKNRVGGRRVEAVLADAGDLTTAEAALADAGIDAAVDAREGMISAAAPDGADDLGRMLAALARSGVRVDEVGLRRPTLDDAFFALTGHAERTERPGMSPIGGTPGRSGAERDRRPVEVDR
jgi:ABC-2 type transport system ATP-binding protein